jgi:hypothetical protein
MDNFNKILDNIFLTINKLLNGKIENSYRLGDMILYKHFRFLPGGKKYHYIHFPSSIATEYMKKTDDENNCKILMEIIKMRKNKLNELPSDNDLVIHLRLGDVIDNDYKSLDNIIQNGNCYVKPLSYYENLFKKLDIKFNRFIIVTGFHESITTHKSFQYIEKLEYIMKKYCLNIVKRIDNNPDDDLIYMTHSYFFVPANGGFSTIIKNIILLNGHEIIE